MFHFIYKTLHKNGKYYIGRHSTTNFEDGYIGSGLWPSSIKDKTTLTREILEYADDEISLKLLEGKYLTENFGKELCMNRTPDPIGFNSENNPMKNPSSVAKISGDNHYMRKDADARKNASDRQLKAFTFGSHPWVTNHPNKDGRNAKQAMKNGTHNSITNNPSTINAQNGTHHWQNGKSPNYEGKLNKKLIEEGRHNFLGPELNKQRVEQGTHNFVGSAANLKMLAEGKHPSQRKITCSCGKTVSGGMYKRWHGNNCKQLKETK
jgi:hypothetical protein